MGKHERPPLPLYERDFYAWTQEQAGRLRGGARNDVDWENVAEEIESLGRSDKRRIERRLKVLLVHLLKWHFQPEKRKGGWRATIREQRRQIGKLVRESPSLRDHPRNELSAEYQAARDSAIDETGLGVAVFPEACPYGIDDVLDDAFLPGEPWVHGASGKN